MKINWVDILIVIYITRAFFLGKKRGLSVELLAILVAFLAWMFSLHLYQPFGISINKWALLSVPTARAAAYIILGMSMLFLGAVIVMLLKKIMKLSFVSRMEQVGGLIVGGIRGVIISAVIVVGAVLIPADFMQREFYVQSFLGNYLVALTPKIHDWVLTSNTDGEDEPKFSNNKFVDSLPRKPKGEVL